MPEPRTGVLVMAYGTPRTPADVEAYYTHIRHGRPPSEEQLADLRRRYDALGGTSPLRAITEAQVTGIQEALDQHAPGRYRVVLGLKHAPPFIEDAVAELLATGKRRAVALVLAPHYSTGSVEQYLARVRAAAGDELDVVAIESWHTEPAYVEWLAEAVDDALDRVTAEREDTEVVFTAHSLPSRVVDAGDDYPDRIAETAELVAGLLALPRWRTGWQSAGATADPWLGPDILEVVPALDAKALVVCACGFVADHLEVLYDLDIETAQLAERHGLAFARTRMPNDDPQFTGMLAELVLRADRRG